MAEAVVGVLIGKLGAALAKETAPYGASLLCREASSLKGLFREIRKAERELESMKAYLRESETFNYIDETTASSSRISGNSLSVSRMSSTSSYTSMRTRSMEDLQPR